MYRSILVAIDGSEYSTKAATHAALLALQADAKLVLFHAAPHVRMPFHTNIYMAPYIEGLDTPQLQTINEEAKNARDIGAKRLLAAAHRELRFADIAIEELFVVDDQPYEAIIETARKYDCDLIVMAPHGHRGLTGILLGSETQKVLTHSPIPVLVVK